MSARERILNRIRATGPITVAEFMEIALYDPEHGYYASSAKRSGRGGDFFTSVDVGPLFGEIVAAGLDEMFRILRTCGEARLALVEAGAGHGRLARDILDAAATLHPRLYPLIDVTLVERSPAARALHASTLAHHAVRLAESREDLPVGIRGVILANELLDALPTHVVTTTSAGLREVYVAERDGELVEVTGDISDVRIPEQLAHAGVVLAPGARAEVNVAACEWIRAAAERLDRGFVLLFDYGHEARELYSEAHAAGTLTSYRSHQAGERWHDAPGEQDITAHVDLTSVRRAAEGAGMTTLGLVDQTYFLLGLGIAERVRSGAEPQDAKRRSQATTLLMPGGLGSTMKVLVLAKNVGRPALRGLSSGRLT